MNLCLIGYGKMGREIEKIARSRGHEVALIIDKDNQSDLDSLASKSCDVAIEFSVPAEAISHIRKCWEFRVPVVCGTTGWYDQVQVLEAEARQAGTALIYSPNFSLGVNLFFRLNHFLGELIQSFPYKARIEETHHTQKLDAPSGTALQLAMDLIRLPGSALSGWTASEKHGPTELPVVSHREGNVPGIHEVMYSSDHDVISIRHEALNRVAFALGAVLAAEFIVNKTGIFTMQNLFDLR